MCLFHLQLKIGIRLQNPVGHFKILDSIDIQRTFFGHDIGENTAQRGGVFMGIQNVSLINLYRPIDRVNFRDILSSQRRRIDFFAGYSIAVCVQLHHIKIGVVIRQANRIHSVTWILHKQFYALVYIVFFS